MVAWLLLLFSAVLAPPPPPPQGDAMSTLITRLEQLSVAGDRAGVLALGAGGAELGELATALTSPAPARIVIRERDRTAQAANRQRLLLEVFAERGMEARFGTWSLDVDAVSTPGAVPNIAAAQRLSVVTGLFRLSLNPSKEYAIRNLSVRAPDLSLDMASGSAFVAETPEGPTAVVLIGRGRMHFAPPSIAERSQARIFSGRDALDSEFDAAFIRIHPSEFESFFPPGALVPGDVNPRSLRRATDVFDEYVGRTLQLDMSDISRDRWSLAPNAGDVIAEIRTRAWGPLTYTRSRGDAEDVALFDRRRRRNIAVYASSEKLAERGRFYSEDDLVPYDVLFYEVDASITPERSHIEATARVKVKVREGAVSTLNMRLAESLQVRGVFSPQFGRLLHLRVIGQNSLIVNLPGSVVGGTEFWLSVTYGGRVPPQALDREAIEIGMRQEMRESYIPIEPNYIYSNRSYWYPQSTVTDYAPARLRITVPSDFKVVATGEPAPATAPPAGVTDPAQRGRVTFVFDAAAPVRYLSCVVSRFTAVDARTVEINLPANGAHRAAAMSGQAEVDEEVDDDTVALSVLANPRQTGRVRGLAAEAADVIRFYASLIGSAPYPSFTIAATESDRPGGHSPAYFAVLNQVVLQSEIVWRNDPVSFENYPAFFLAHEVAHQWWGHAVGWKNYHEQWISEGFAQYFAALYAEKERGGNVLDNLLRQMRHTAIAASPQGPIYLGYRLGHIRGDDRVFRSIVYNKGAMVLHMLRRLVGDDAFFAGLRAFYEEWRFKKAGTDDFRRAMETASGRELERFFDYWVYGATVPSVKFKFDVTDAGVDVRFEQREPVDVPITVTITYDNGKTDEVIVALTGTSTALTLPLKGRVRTVTANNDNAALVVLER